MPAKFIVLEGPDGSGTTTHVRLLADKLRTDGKTVFTTCEPTGGPIGAFIRESLHGTDIPAETLQLLFCADRSWHLQKEVLPALGEYDYVLSDRYWLSTIVYSDATGVDSKPLLSLNKSFVQPEVTVVLLPPFEVCMDRLSERSNADRMEGSALQKKVYEEYARRAKEYGYPVVNSSGDKETASNTIFSLIS